MTDDILLYLEDAPIGAHRASRGLSALNAALICGLGPDVPVYLAQTHQVTSQADWDPRFQSAIVEMGAVALSVLKGGRKFGPRAAMIGSAVAARLIPRAVRGAAGEWVFAPIGTDLWTAVRGAMLARHLGRRLALYFVDDILANMRAAGGDEAACRNAFDALAGVLASTSAVFAITHALGQVVKANWGVDCVALPLPFEPSDAEPSCDRASYDVIHIGAINHIYASGLIKVSRAMARANATGLRLQLRLTGQPNAELRAQFDPSVPVIVESFHSVADMRTGLARALCAVVPVEAEPSGMYKTSFPSKLLQYLDSCHRIVAFGPADAAAVQYFAENELAYWVCDIDGLAHLLTQLAQSRPSHRTSYGAAIKKSNAACVVGGIVRKRLALG